MKFYSKCPKCGGKAVCLESCANSNEDFYYCLKCDWDSED